MKAYVMEAPDRGGIREVDEPTPGDYVATVEMVVCGICSSTDRMLRQGTFRSGVSFPSILGHESVGRVVEVGKRVRYLEPGQLVTRCSAYSWDTAPIAMYWGGFAERGVVADSRAWTEDHPDQQPRDHFPHVAFNPTQSPENLALAISLSETWSVATAEAVMGTVVGVCGTGVAGLSLVAYARLLGAARVVCIGRRDERLDLARQLGATDAARTGEAASRLFRDLGGADIVFEASGSADAISGAYHWLRDDGRLVIYSAPEDPTSLNVMGSPRRATVVVARPREGAVMESVVKMLNCGLIPAEAFLNGHYELGKMDNAFADIEAGRIVKALVQFPQGDNPR